MQYHMSLKVCDEEIARHKRGIQILERARGVSVIEKDGSILTTGRFCNKSKRHD